MKRRTFIARSLITATDTVRVNYNSYFGTATGDGSDYTNVSGVLEFPTNVATRTIAITIIDDNVDEQHRVLRDPPGDPEPDHAALPGRELRPGLEVL